MFREVGQIDGQMVYPFAMLFHVVARRMPSGQEPDEFMDKLRCPAVLRIGALRSDAGIVGAALATSLAPGKL